MPSQRTLVLINPLSGNREGRVVYEALTRGAPDSLFTVAEIDFANLGRQLTDTMPWDRLVIAGGDGTISAVLTHEALPSLPVGIIPLGTANDIARECGLLPLWRKLSPYDYVVRLCELPSSPFSTWNLATSDRVIPFAAYCSFGFEGLVVRDFAAWRARSAATPERVTYRSLGRLRNRLAYTAASVQNLGYRLSPLHLSNDRGDTKESLSGMSLLITNVRTYMGLGYNTTTSSPEDTTIECSVARSVLDYVCIMGAGLGVTSPLAPIIRGSSVLISGLAPNTALQVDGEFVQPLQAGDCRIELRRTIQVVSARGINSLR